MYSRRKTTDVRRRMSKRIIDKKQHGKKDIRLKPNYSRERSEKMQYLEYIEDPLEDEIQFYRIRRKIKDAIRENKIATIKNIVEDGYISDEKILWLSYSSNRFDIFNILLGTMHRDDICKMSILNINRSEICYVNSIFDKIKWFEKDFIKDSWIPDLSLEYLENIGDTLRFLQENGVELGYMYPKCKSSSAVRFLRDIGASYSLEVYRLYNNNSVSIVEFVNTYSLFDDAYGDAYIRWELEDDWRSFKSVVMEITYAIKIQSCYRRYLALKSVNIMRSRPDNLFEKDYKKSRMKLVHVVGF